MSKDKTIIERLRRKNIKFREKSLAANELAKTLALDLRTQIYLRNREERMVKILQNKLDNLQRKYYQACTRLERLISKEVKVE